MTFTCSMNVNVFSISLRNSLKSRNKKRCAADLLKLKNARSFDFDLQNPARYSSAAENSSIRNTSLWLDPFYTFVTLHVFVQHSFYRIYFFVVEEKTCLILGVWFIQLYWATHRLNACSQTKLCCCFLTDLSAQLAKLMELVSSTLIFTLTPARLHNVL